MTAGKLPQADSRRQTPPPSNSSSPPARPAKLQAWHLDRLAIVYVRQSTPQQVCENTESTQRQYALARRAVDLGCRGLDPRFDLRTHSPDGFNWGYSGSGPAQLALALAADVLGDDEAALGVYQRLKFRVVGRLPAEGWTLTEGELADAIRSLAPTGGE